MARNKRAYIEREGRIESVIVFLAEQMYPDTTNLAEKAQKMVLEGLSLHSGERSQPPWETIDFSFSGDPIFSLIYSPDSLECRKLETWISQWRECFHQVDYTGGVMPNDGCFVSYSSSMEERLSWLPE